MSKRSRKRPQQADPAEAYLPPKTRLLARGKLNADGSLALDPAPGREETFGADLSRWWMVTMAATNEIANRQRSRSRVAPAAKARQQATAERDQQIAALAKAGEKDAVIEKSLGLSAATVARAKRRLRSSGRLPPAGARKK